MRLAKRLEGEGGGRWIIWGRGSSFVCLDGGVRKEDARGVCLDIR
jgi:hypothetical protein